MKKHFLLLLTILFSINCFSQITFESGYYIDNSGTKIDCLIKNVDWKNNPTEFEYQPSAGSATKIADITSVSEFGIYNSSKYLRKTVMMDRSRSDVNHLSEDKNPVFNEEQIFLKVLIEGQASLFSYTDGTLRRYFYGMNDSAIEQLVYKEYLNKSNLRTNKGSNQSLLLGKNNQYKQQLWNNLKCSTITIKTVERLEYKKNSLVSFFSLFNECNDFNFTNYEENKKHKFFGLAIRPRLNYSSLSITNSHSSPSIIDFENKLSYGIGIEAEFILPFNKNKWAISIETIYQNYKANTTADVATVSGGKLISNVDYSSIEIPVGLKHCLYLNNNSKLHLSIAFIFDSSSSSQVEIKRTDGSLFNSYDIKTRNNLALGIGYKMNNKYGVELRHNFGREILSLYSQMSSSYQTISLIFGYSIF